MKKRLTQCALLLLAVLLCTVTLTTPAHAISFSTEDVTMVLSSVSGYLIVIGIVLLAMIVVIIAVRKLDKPKKRFIRIQAIVAFIVVTAICFNMILLNVYYNTLNTFLAANKDIADSSRAASAETVERVVDEGIVLAQNDDGILPLSGNKLNVFGWASSNPIYGGSGSGASDASTSVSLLQGLSNAGIETNKTLSDFYTAFRADRPVAGTSVQDFTLPEPTADSYTEDMLSEAENFSDTAMIVLGRIGGENFDLPTDMYDIIHNDSFDPSSNSIGFNGIYVNNGTYDDFEKGQSYLTLSKTEKDLVDLVCGRFDHVIVLYNGMNPMEMGWVEQYSQIQAVLLCPGVGGSGFNSLGNILTGIVNPSGHTVDIWPYDLTKAPYFNNIGEFHYTNLDDYAADITAADVGVNPGGLFYFVNYVEGIYVGYKFYETAAEEGLIDYASSVKYPFGYGLSYTTFEQKMGDLAVDSAAGTITVTVTVTNTGNFAGKDVVQVYFNPPYTNGGIEKASANLIQFEKTALLEPGKSQDVTLTFQVDDMASFDDNGAGCYVLEAGDYEISIRNNSHDVIDQRTYTQSSTVTFNSESRSTDAVPALTAFDDAKGDVTYLSRADHFANYEAATAAPSDDQYVMSDDVRATYISNANYDAAADSDPNAVMPELGKKNNVKLADLRGLSYDDPKWDELLDMLSIEEMSGLITYGGWSTNAIPSIGKVATSDCDGPAGVNNFLKGKYGSSYCVETMLAQTWSKELAYAFGEGIGQELADLDNFGWYGPAMDTHRSAFGGRNFEYYSEDGVLGGYIAAAEVNGAQSKGVYAYLKHFAMNDQEIKCRSLLCTWSCEQAIREIYLKPFELAVKNYNGQGLAIMNGFNFIGTTWTGASRSLLTTVLRDEWGFRGFVCTDYFGGYGYMNAQRGIRAGTDLMLNMVSEFAAITDTSATSVQAMRQSTKNILYTVVNSGAYEPENLAEVTGTPDWVKTIYKADAVIGGVVVLLEVLAFYLLLKKKNTKVDVVK